MAVSCGSWFVLCTDFLFHYQMWNCKYIFEKQRLVDNCMRNYGTSVSILHLLLISERLSSVEKFTESFLSQPLEQTMWFESFNCNYNIYIFYVYLENILQTWYLTISSTNSVKVPFPVLEDFIPVNYQTDPRLVGLVHFRCISNNMLKNLTLGLLVVL